MKFPKKLYVKMEKDGDITYPVPAEEMIDIVELGDTVHVGVYELVETTYAVCEVKTSGRVSKR